ncbi:MAG: orotate phosphoribosyltransferase [Kiritimatiellae bacterium]|nr:orotate phosphoribosyltransferase [Kiritimatiellia bacterium]MBR1837486.1 orotate phosphoribosyltransferase [Kiritimatiellia bacterium]
MPLSQEQVLSALRETGALLKGHFELRSGLHSPEFFQCANLLRFPRIAGELCAELASRIPAAAAAEATTVVSPALGGILVGHEVARALDKKCIFAEKKDGALVMRRFKIEPGEPCIVAEDVVTRGGRVQETIDIVRSLGGRVLAVATLVDRSGGKASFGDIPHVSLLEMEPVTYEPSACPLCAAGGKAYHPGS